jgi:hypothetical protein
MSSTRVQQCIRHFPAELKRRLVTDATARDTNMNDIAVQILAAAYRYPYEPNGLRPPAPARLSGTDQVTLMLPLGLRVRVGVSAERAGRSRPQEMLRVLCAHYQLPVAA